MVVFVTFLVIVWVAGVLLPWDDVAKHDSRLSVCIHTGILILFFPERYNAIRKTLTSAGADAAKRAEAYWKVP